MENLAKRDLEQALDLTGRLHACHDPGKLRRATVVGVSQLIGADHVTFEHFAPTVPQLWAVAEPDEAYEPWMWQTFLAHIDEHPAINHYRRTGDLAALKISDFVSVRAWHRTALYQKLYRRLGIEDQMGICLAPPDQEFYSVVLARSARSFTARDRALLNLLRDHISQAHENARAFDRLKRLAKVREQAADYVSQCAIQLDQSGNPVDIPPKARQWMRSYCGPATRGTRLPPQVDDWVHRRLRGEDRSANSIRPLTLKRKGSRLVLRLRLSASNSQPVIVAEELSDPDDTTLHALGLTRRQCEILLEVEKGATNAEIAATHFISPHTVRTHLGNIFEILGVVSRSAAVARLRRIL